MFDLQNTLEADFLRQHFGKYYDSHKVMAVPDLNMREFGYGVFKRKIANRNMYFSSEAEMNIFLRESVPMFFSYSNSCYKFPGKTPMNTKGWVKSDLIYEFDADELGLNVEEINGIQWFEKPHLDEARRQVFRLMEFLEKDFNFPLDSLAINFSGKAGYHVHLRWSGIQNLNKRARIELVDYLTGHNLDFVNLGFNFDSLSCPHKGLWVKRLSEGVRDFFTSDVKVIAGVMGTTNKKAVSFAANGAKIYDLMQKGRLFAFDVKKDAEFWENILTHVANAVSVPIDRQTSTDLNKIVRVPSTLHGDTGLLAKNLSIDALKNFDPYLDSVVFDKSEVKVSVVKAPKFSLGGESFGPFENEDVSLPLFCAVYLIGKGAAVLKK
jgi:DNA primase small subunit